MIPLIENYSLSLLVVKRLGIISFQKQQKR